MSPRTAPLALLVATLGASACGPLRRGGSASDAAIVFVNESLDQATVYALSPSGFEQRLGTVMSGRTTTLRVPASVFGSTGSVNIVARLSGRSQLPRTGPLSLSAGDRVQVTLPVDARTLNVLPVREP